MSKPVYTLAIEYYSFHYGIDAVVFERDISRWWCEHHIRMNWDVRHKVVLSRDGRAASFAMTENRSAESQAELIDAAFTQLDTPEN